MDKLELFEIFNDLKHKYENTILLTSSPHDKDDASGLQSGSLFTDGTPEDLLYMLGYCMGKLCKDMTAELPEAKKEAVVTAAFKIFQLGISDLYEGGSHDQNNKD